MRIKLLKVRPTCFCQSIRPKSDRSGARLAVVGSGPAGFYSIQSLLKRWSECTVDLYEKLPVPYGLVRYGVAPDHPEVKNCIHQFEKTAEEFGPQGRFQFFGNVDIGKDLAIRDLAESYDAVLLAYGSGTERKLGIEGENVRNCFSARQFVGWYNGHPDVRNLNLDLSNLGHETAVILGHGNVALDAARILLAPKSLLQYTDITAPAMDQLKKSKIRRVILIGRRGPLQVSFTIAELREMIRLAECGHMIDKSDFKAIEDGKILDRLERPRKRLTQLMIDNAKNFSDYNTSGDKRWILKFLRTPERILTTQNAVSGIELVENCLEIDGDNYSEAKAIPLEPRRTEIIPCGLILYSIGYQSLNIDPEGYLPFDQKRQIIATENFKVMGTKNIYACGWCALGARGVIASTQSQSRTVAEKIIADFSNADQSYSKPGFENIENILRKKNLRWVDWEGWKKIDNFEVEAGRKAGKSREKIVDIEKMLDIAGCR